MSSKGSSPAGRYRKISLRMHGDARFRRLSDPPPCGKYLWYYLISGPHTGPIPGVFVAGEAQLAEALRWPLEGFREAFREVSGEAFPEDIREGSRGAHFEPMVRVDFDARLLWLPQALKHNPPQSANVVRGWKTAWEELPECSLKALIYQRFRAFFEDFGEGYLKAFLEAFGEALPEAFGEPGAGAGAGYRAGAGKTHALPRARAKTENPDSNNSSRRLKIITDPDFEPWYAAYPRKQARADAEKAWQQTAAIRPPLPDLLAKLAEQADSHDWRKDGGRYIPLPASYLRGHRWGDEVRAVEVDNGQPQRPGPATSSTDLRRYAAQAGADPELFEKAERLERESIERSREQGRAWVAAQRGEGDAPS